MERIRELLTQFQEWISQQGFYQEIRARWEELDPQSQFYVRMGSIVGACLLVVAFVIGSIASTYHIKSLAHQKQDLLGVVQQANDEMKYLRSITGNSPSETAPPPPVWNQVIESVATQVGIPRESVTLLSEKQGTGSPTAKEALLEIQLQRTNIRKLVKFSVELENNAIPLKIRNIQVGTLGAEGHIQAKIAVSGFIFGKKN